MKGEGSWCSASGSLLLRYRQVFQALRVGCRRFADLIDRVGKDVLPDVVEEVVARRVSWGRPTGRHAAVRPVGVLTNVGGRDQAAGVAVGGLGLVNVDDRAELV